jgi:hypothetical protein
MRWPAVYRYSVWLLLSLVLVLFGLGVAWLSQGPQLGQRIRLMPTGASKTEQSVESSNFRVRDRVFHHEFGHGTVVATDGPKLTIEFDDGGVKRMVLDSFVVRSDEPRPPQ